ncbi:MAG: DNA-directed RNA polymerase subunit N [archaeon]|jgi:DNA-directed RNA polymerase subunit N|nr:DNA-directed RNA polymerase subunit N [Euryarchaeota archaeon]MDP7260397.1 DNA-directed RNA polymerase subunit N [archaeon]|tara:strand:- start:52733 stop:52927 length:195 start_codon:yes stop_codon:yes gene_type:complete
MIIPVRCFTCGKAIAAEYEEYKKRVEAGEKPQEVMDALKLSRYCCRRMLVSQVDLIDEVAQFKY